MADHLVIDASALIELVLVPGERGSAVADAVHDRGLLAPHLLPFEVWNVLRRLHNGRGLRAADAAAARRDVRELPIALWPTAPLEQRIWDLGANLSTYDASYVALAEATGTTLLTCDARLARAPGLRCEVMLVE